MHHYRDGTIPHPTLGRAAPPAVLTSDARRLYLYEYTPRRGDVVFDIGAGIGAETLLFSRLVGSAGRVVSVEAHTRTFRRLVDLCRANELANVTTLNLAITDEDGEARISDGPEHLRNALTANGGIRVQARRLDTLARDLGVARLDLLKMNIEGAEREALPGMGTLLDRTRHVCISCHDFLSDDLRTKAFVTEFLTEHGFRLTARDDAPEPWTRDYVYGTRVTDA
jgi:FkbM family methyltransferase